MTMQTKKRPCITNARKVNIYAFTPILTLKIKERYSNIKAQKRDWAQNWDAGIPVYLWINVGILPATSYALQESQTPTMLMVNMTCDTIT